MLWRERKAAAALIIGLAAASVPTSVFAHSSAESVVFGRPPAEESLDVIIVEGRRDPDDRRPKSRSAREVFRQAIEGSDKPLGLSRLEDGSECFRASRGGHAMCLKSGNDAPAAMDRLSPYGAVTQFQAGSAGFGH